MRHAKKCLLLAGTLSIVGGSQAIFAFSSDSNGQWNYGTLDNPIYSSVTQMLSIPSDASSYGQWNYSTLDNPIYAAVAQIPSFLWNWNYGTLDMPIWFSFGSSEGNNSGINVGIITNTSRSENSSSSLQKEEIIENAYRYKFSPDGLSFAYIKKVNGKDFFVKDGLESEQYERVYDFAYSPDGKSVAYRVYNDGGYFLIKDGVKSKKYRYIGVWTYSPDSKSFAYEATDENGNDVIIKDGVVVSSSKYTQVSTPTYSPDSKSFTYRAQAGDYFLVKDGVPLVDFAGVRDFSYTPDSKNYVYSIYEDGKYFLVKDGIKSKGYGYITNWIYSPDGKSFAYEALGQDGKEVIIKDGVMVSSEYGYVSDLTYSPDSKNFVYQAVDNDGNHVIVKDGVVVSSKYKGAGSLTYSPDGKSFAYRVLGQDGKLMIIIDGLESDKYDYIDDISYSSDGKSIAYSVQMNGVLSTIKQNLSEGVVDLRNSSKETVMRKILDIDSFELDPQVKLANYTQKKYNYSYSFPIATFYQGFVAPTGVTHEMVLKASAPPTSRIDGDIVVDFYQGRILPELQGDDFVQIENRFYIVKGDSTFVIEDVANNQQSKNILDIILATITYQE